VFSRSNVEADVPGSDARTKATAYRMNRHLLKPESSGVVAITTSMSAIVAGETRSWRKWSRSVFVGIASVNPFNQLPQHRLDPGEPAPISGDPGQSFIRRRKRRPFGSLLFRPFDKVHFSSPKTVDKVIPIRRTAESPSGRSSNWFRGIPTGDCHSVPPRAADYFRRTSMLVIVLSIVHLG
jgi:hypothetical protein